jgi:hypothetical protein
LDGPPSFSKEANPNFRDAIARKDTVPSSNRSQMPERSAGLFQLLKAVSW